MALNSVVATKLARVHCTLTIKVIIIPKHLTQKRDKKGEKKRGWKRQRRGKGENGVGGCCCHFLK